MMDEREPQWYEQARKGPFQDARFTDSSAEQVMRRLRTESEPARPRSRRMPRLAVMAAVILLLLAGAATLYLKLGPSGAETPAGVTLPVEDKAELTDEALKKIAEQLILKQLGRKIPFEKLEHEQRTGRVQLVYSEYSKAYAMLRLNAETGEADAYTMNAAFGAEAIDSKLISDAREKLQELGYTGEFSVTGSTRYVDYGRSPDHSVQVQNVITAADAAINFTNGAYERAYFEMDQNEVIEELKQAGLEALGMLRSSSLEDQLTRVIRTTAEGAGDEISLYYGDGRGGDTFVTFDYATSAVLDVADYALNLADLGDSRTDEERDELLLSKDNAILQSTAAVIADRLYGVKLKEDYTLIKNEPRPGVITFESHSGGPTIEAAYNMDGVMYSFSIKRASNTL
ncbi:hypothetical protein [Paenibacillus typhae]|uniref:Uncharacterized protein n=1 Tax=Paenibacillus typhae TaxID=1174501 RepID=A0A1G9HNU1_9BACL|nr:hypothetical protein [Paenibacillus typhae]SDL14183.1 hypothetical protein SAMN05216192_1793 [Paenibacillus typhae]